MVAMLIANEPVNEHLYKKRDGKLCKLNMEKANHVDWDFINYMLARMDFNSRWRQWIKPCTITTFFATMVNRVHRTLLKHRELLNKGIYFHLYCL